ncbi:MAG: hypothetical protein LBI72_10235 [Flavobacteriaceae bacterium]|jgi:hypothetical protein|nr:hypothetical protein [Flavobacteriaceae bacterium]
MKKLPFLALIFLFSMCKTTKSIFTPEKELTVEEKIEKIKEEDRLPEAEDVMDLPDYAQVRDDFRSVSESSKNNYLKGMNATDSKYSVVVLTQGYKGENITIKNNGKNIYHSMTMSDLKTGIAKSVRVDNTHDIVLSDNYTKGSLTIASDHAKMFKFIYVMKNNGNKETPFKVTFSNTLRPAR